MTSAINPYNIDGTYPIAGQDNSSQGFRDNFTNTKSNFISASAEISDLQSKALVTSALNGQTILNDMAGTPIARPQLKSWTETVNDLGVVSTVATLDFSIANFQKLTTGAPIQLSLINWQTGTIGYGSMRVWINCTNIAHTITLPMAVSIGTNDLAGFNETTNQITFDQVGTYVFDISSADGATYFIEDASRNRASLRDSQLYYNADVQNTLMINYGSSLSSGLQLESQWGDSVAAIGGFDSMYFGNLSSSSSTGAGFYMTSARGNLQTGTATVQSNDPIGLIGAYMLTGSGSGNIYTSGALIQFYATGTHTTTGLGGNIAFMTSADNGSVSTQAMSINSDASVEVIGSFRTDGAIIEHGTVVVNFSTSSSSYSAPSTTSTLIIDTINSATTPSATIVLPPNPVDKQKFKISSCAPITSANVYGGGGTIVKYISSSYFASGNVGASLTFNSATSTWYRI